MPSENFERVPSLRLPDDFYSYENKLSAEELAVLNLFREECEEGANDEQWNGVPIVVGINRSTHSQQN